MSVVVAKILENEIEISADSICVLGRTKVHSGTKISKIEKYNDMIIGGCGETEEISLFFHYMKTHTIEHMDERHVLDFIIEFKRWKNDLIQNSSLKNSYILAYKGKCFGISNMLVYEITNYDAIGAGMDYALGALYQGATAEEAVKAACDLCCYVSEPIITQRINR